MSKSNEDELLKAREIQRRAPTRQTEGEEEKEEISAEPWEDTHSTSEAVVVGAQAVGPDSAVVQRERSKHRGQGGGGIHGTVGAVVQRGRVAGTESDNYSACLSRENREKRKNRARSKSPGPALGRTLSNESDPLSNLSRENRTMRERLKNRGHGSKPNNSPGTLTPTSRGIARTLTPSTPRAGDASGLNPANRALRENRKARSGLNDSSKSNTSKDRNLPGNPSRNQSDIASSHSTIDKSEEKKATSLRSGNAISNLEADLINKQRISGGGSSFDPESSKQRESNNSSEFRAPLLESQPLDWQERDRDPSIQLADNSNMIVDLDQVDTKGLDEADEVDFPTLVEATVVQEPDLVMAEPLVENADVEYIDEPPQEESKTGVSFRRRWILLAVLIFLALVVGVGLLGGLLLNNGGSKVISTASETKDEVVGKDQNTTQPSLRPSSRPSLHPTAAPSPQQTSNIFWHSNSNASQPTPFNQSNATVLVPLDTGSPTHAPTNMSITTEAPTAGTASPTTMAPTESPTLATLAPTTMPTVVTPSPTEKPYSWLNIDYLPDYTLEKIALSTETSQGRANTWLKAHPQYDTMPVWRKQQLQALGTLYWNTGGDQPVYDAWMDHSVNECGWIGEDKTFQPNCTSSGQYQYLHVGGDGLRGRIPNQIALLASLNSIIMRSNDLGGTVPTRLGLLTQLTHLTLGGNRFGGTIPEELGGLTKLTLLVLRGNQMVGTIPPVLAKLTKLNTMTIYENQFTGTLPPLGNLTALSSLVAYRNQLSGTIPPDIASLTGMRFLRLKENYFTGPVLDTLSQLTKLEDVQLYNNIGFNGTIPSFMADLTALTNLELHNTSITGTIPVQMCGFALKSLTVNCDLVNCSCAICKCE